MILVFWGLLSLVPGHSQSPILRVKTGFSDLSVNAGERLTGEKLQSMVTFQPSVVWNFPTFSSRLGLHFLSEIGSPYSNTPLSGIGLSGYYYLYGIASAYELTDDEVLIQKSRPGPYLVVSFTPVNFNLNQFDEEDSSNNFFFNALLSDILVGLGFEYPFRQNMLFAGEVALRSGTSLESSDDTKITYSGFSVFLTFATSYY